MTRAARRATTTGRMLALAAVAFGVWGAPASANIFTANTFADITDADPGDGICATSTGACTLRAAVSEANQNPGSDEIVLSAGTYDVRAETLYPDSALTIRGAGARSTVISGGGTTRVFFVTSGALGLADLTIANGRAPSSIEPAGASGFGSAVNATSIDATTSVTLDRVTLRDNVSAPAGAASGGGALASQGAALTVRSSTIAHNSATAGSGGAFGGGISSSGPLTVANSTIVDNAATAPAARGGGIWLDTLPAALDHVTIARNKVNATSGARAANLAGGAPTVKNSIVSDPLGSGAVNCSGSPVPAGRNLDSGDSCGFGPTALKNIAADLGPLGDHGGPTDTAIPGFPEVDAGVDCAASATDQRGRIRPVGLACDLGAVEVAADLRVALTVAPTSLVVGESAVFSATVTNTGIDTAQGVLLSSTLSAGASFVAAAPSSGACTIIPGLSCAHGDLLPGATASIAITVKARAAGTAVLWISAMARPADPTPDDATAEASIDITSGPSSDVPPPATPLRCQTKLTGSAGRDRLTGTDASERLDGLGGNDALTGRGGDDCLYGGSGNDRLTGGSGDDELRGGAGNDVLVGGGDADRLSGGAGRDEIRSRDGEKDAVTCGSGRDRVSADRLDNVSRDCESVSRK